MQAAARRAASQATPSRPLPGTVPVISASPRSRLTRAATREVEPPIAAEPSPKQTVPIPAHPPPGPFRNMEILKAAPRSPAMDVPTEPVVRAPLAPPGKQAGPTPAGPREPVSALKSATTTPTVVPPSPAGPGAPKEPNAEVAKGAPTAPGAPPPGTEGPGAPGAGTASETETGEQPNGDGTSIKAPPKKSKPGEAQTAVNEPGSPVAEGNGAEGAAGGAVSAATAVRLHMPEPPAGPSPATIQRIQGVQARARTKAVAHSALPGGAAQVGAARKAVTEPEAEAVAKAQAALMAQVKAAPSPEIVKLGERIREVIRKKRPPDEDALMAAEPEAEAVNAGKELNATVDSETKKVQGNYGPMNNAPSATAPAKGENLPPQPATAATAPLDAQAATPDAVPASKVTLDQDAAESSKKAQDAGMDTAPADLVKSGPVAEARNAQGELDQAAKEDPAKVLEGQKQALGKAEGDMAALQARALAALEASRESTAKGNATRQDGMVTLRGVEARHGRRRGQEGLRGREIDGHGSA